MQIVCDADDLRPLVESIVAETLRAAAQRDAKLPVAQLAYTEPDAAAAIGIRHHQLRDARIRGEIVATRLGGRIGYTRDALIAYLQRGEAA